MRKFARNLVAEFDAIRRERDDLREHVERLGGLTIREREEKLADLNRQLSEQQLHVQQERQEADASLQKVKGELDQLRQSIVVTEEVALLQEAGVYDYRHPLSDAVGYEKELEELQGEIKEMNKKDGGAVLSITDWTVNGSKTEGRKMVRDFSKLMLRAFNAEADNLVHDLKPFKLKGAIERLNKVASTIERLGSTMRIRISTPYLQLRVRELELTADFLQKQAAEKEAERLARERLREERKVQQEIERERAKLEKERQHYANALAALVANGDESGAERLREQMADVDRAIADVDYRAANIRRDTST